MSETTGDPLSDDDDQRDDVQRDKEQREEPGESGSRSKRSPRSRSSRRKPADSSSGSRRSGSQRSSSGSDSPGSSRRSSGASRSGSSRSGSGSSRSGSSRSTTASVDTSFGSSGSEKYYDELKKTDRNRIRSAPTSLVWFGRAILLLIILISPWWLGSVHKPAQLTLCCLAVLGLAVWWIELAITRNTKSAIPILAVVVAAGLVLGLMQLVPLPVSVANVIAPNQAEILGELGKPVEGEVPVGATDHLKQLQPSTTLSLNPEGSLDYINLLVLGLICLLLSCHYFNSRHSVSWLIAVLVIQGTALSIFSIYQRMSFNGRLYWVLEKFDGKPFGPFINRNNAGGYLLLCLAGSLGFAYLAFTKIPRNQRPRPLIGKDYPILKRIQLRFNLFISELTPAKIASLITTITIFSAVVVSLSRGAVVALIVASVLTMWFVGFAKYPKATLLFSAATLVFAISLVAWLGYGDSLSDRFESLNSQEQIMVEGRFSLWQDAMRMVPDYPIFGCGLNAFKDVFRSYRESRELSYFEYAENTYVQTLVELGVVGALLLLLAIVLMIFSIHKLLRFGNSRKTVAAATVGTFALISQMTASMFDFGLYIPAVTVLMAVVCGFIAGQTQSLAERSKKKWSLTMKIPSWLLHAAILLLFSGGVLVCMNLYGIVQVNSAISRSPLGLDYQSLSLEECDRQIELLDSKIGYAPGSAGYKRLGELNLHRCRLQIFERQKTAARIDRVPDDQKDAYLDSLWDQSSLLTMHRQMSLTRQQGTPRQVELLLRDPILVEHMPKVSANLLAARYYMPLDPGIHLMLAQCQVFSNAPQNEEIHLNRASAITPNNVAVSFTIGILHLQSGRLETGKKILRRCLALNPAMVPQVVGFSTLTGITKKEIFDEILPKTQDFSTAVILNEFAKKYLIDDSEQSLKSDVLERANELLSEVGDRDRKALSLRADIKEGQNKFEEAIAIKLQLVQLDPLNESLHRELYSLYQRTEQWKNAIRECEWLSKYSRNSKKFSRELKKIKSKAIEAGVQ